MLASGYWYSIKQTYRVLLFVFLGIDAHARGTTSRHCRIDVLPCKKLLTALAPMHTLNNLGSNQRALRDDTLEGDHSVQVGGTERPRVAGIFSECANKAAMVVLDTVRSQTSIVKVPCFPYHIVSRFPRWPIRQSLDDLFKGLFEGIRVFIW